VIQIHRDNGTNLAALEAMLHEDREKHIYQLDRAAFTDQQLFDLEMKYIFEGNWVYLAHESQIPNANVAIKLLVEIVTNPLTVFVRPRFKNRRAVKNTQTPTKKAWRQQPSRRLRLQDIYARSSLRIGNRRIRLPVNANTALQIAGATTGNPGSPIPVGASLLITT